MTLFDILIGLTFVAAVFIDSAVRRGKVFFGAVPVGIIVLLALNSKFAEIQEKNPAYAAGLLTAFFCFAFLVYRTTTTGDRVLRNKGSLCQQCGAKLTLLTRMLALDAPYYCGKCKPNAKRVEEEFWRTTWERWRAGALSELFPSYQRQAEVPFETFLKHSPAGSSPMNLFMREHSPLNGEFLISCGSGRPEQQTVFVLTSLRLFIRNRRNKCYDAILLSDLMTAQVTKAMFTTTVTLVKQNGEEAVFQKLKSAPSELALRRAIAHNVANDAWDVQAKPAPVIPKNAERTCPACGLRYHPSNYVAESPTWYCSGCKKELPRE